MNHFCGKILSNCVSSSKNNYLDTVQSNVKRALDSAMFNTQGELLRVYKTVGDARGLGYKSKILFYTEGVDDETSLFLAVKVYFRVLSKK